MEVTVSKLEQEIVSLHFQLSQERNERRLAEYRLRQSASQSLSAYSFDSMKEEVLIIFLFTLGFSRVKKLMSFFLI